MDRELAQAVISRYQSGLPVAEEMFFKAAQAVGANPSDALLEARWETLLHHDLPKLASGARLSPQALSLYSAAAGEDPRALTKTASRYRMDPQRLVMLKLAENNWVPNLRMLKIAMMMPEQAQAPMADPMAAGGGAAAPAMPPPDQAQPMPGAQVQQQRYKPSPMAPMQTPPSSEGNLRELVDAARHPDAAADAQAAQQQPGGSMGPEEAPGSMGPDAGPGMDMQAAPPPPPMAPEEKLQQADPNIPPENLSRYAEKLTEIEQQTGIPMQDPGQVKKFLAQMQKDDAKVLDEAIKGMSTEKPFSSGGGGAAPAPASDPSTGAEKIAGLRRLQRLAASHLKGTKGLEEVGETAKKKLQRRMNKAPGGRDAYLDHSGVGDKATSFLDAKPPGVAMKKTAKLRRVYLP